MDWNKRLFNHSTEEDQGQKQPRRRYYAGLFLLFFLMFTTVISSDLFDSKVNVELGEPSPELIVAPYYKEIDDLNAYQQEQEQLASQVSPVYAADEGQIAFLREDLTQTFLILREQKRSSQPLSETLRRLHASTPFTILPDQTLADLLEMPEREVDKGEETLTAIVLGIARGPDAGAKSATEIPLLRDRMKEQVNKSSLSASMKTFAQAYIELKVLKPTLVVDEEETKKRKEAASTVVRSTVRTYQANQKIVGPGEIVDDKIFQVLVAYGLIEVNSPWKPTFGIALSVLMTMIILMVFGYQISPELFRTFKRFILIGVLMALVLAMGKAFLAINLGNSDLNHLTSMLIPVAWVTMTVTILLGVRIAKMVCISLGVFIGLMADPGTLGVAGFLAIFFALISGSVGILSVSRLDRRTDLARAGLFVGLANVATASAVALMLGFNGSQWFVGVLLGLANGFLSSVLTMGALPWFEAGFNITSAVRLLELSNPNAPLLKSLLMEAPGTYHHSVMVGNLAETAAEAVHADPVLVRVGALYHDIGKLKRPYFFIENQFSKDNPHDKISPTLSSLIVTSHTKDGLEMAKEHKLPEALQAFIVEHHGDSLTNYFYRKALEENPKIPQEAFRYDGRRPQSKETALVLLADSVEAAVRSQRVNSPGKIEGLVRKIIKDKFDEGLLSQCDLTFRDLDKIAVAFVKVLSGIFHSRIEYPDIPASRMNLLRGEQTEAAHSEDPEEISYHDGVMIQTVEDDHTIEDHTIDDVKGTRV